MESDHNSGHFSVSESDFHTAAEKLFLACVFFLVAHFLRLVVSEGLVQRQVQYNIQIPGHQFSFLASSKDFAYSGQISSSFVRNTFKSSHAGLLRLWSRRSAEGW